MVPNRAEGAPVLDPVRSAARRLIDRGADRGQRIGQGPAEDEQPDRRERAVSASTRPYSTRPCRRRSLIGLRRTAWRSGRAAGMRATSRTRPPSRRARPDADGCAPGPRSPATSGSAARRSSRGARPRPRRARALAGPPPSRPAPAAGPVVRLGRDVHVRGAHRVADRPGSLDDGVEVVRPSRAAARPGPVSAARYATRASSSIRNSALSRSIGSRRSVPIDSKSTGTPARWPRSRVARRSVGTSPRSSRTIGPDVEDERLRGVERLLDHRDQVLAPRPRRPPGPAPRAAPRSAPGGRCSSGSGPARRASRGRSRGGDPPGRRGPAPASSRVARPSGARARPVAAAIRRPPATAAGRRRRSSASASRYRPIVLRLPSSTSTWLSMRTAPRVSVTSLLGQLDDARRAAPAPAGELGRGRALLLVPARPRSGPGRRAGRSP